MYVRFLLLTIPAFLASVSLACAQTDLPAFDDIGRADSTSYHTNLSIETQTSGLVLQDVTAKNAAELYMLLEKPPRAVAQLRDYYADTFKEKWPDEAAKATPSVGKLTKKMTKWYGVSPKQAELMKNAVQAFLKDIAEKGNKLGRLREQLETLLTEDVTAKTEEAFEREHNKESMTDPYFHREVFDGKPDWKNKYNYHQAAMRLLFLVCMHNEILLLDESSPLFEKCDIPNAYSQAHDKNNPWSSFEKLRPPSKPSDQELQAYSNYEKAFTEYNRSREAVARQMGIDVTKVRPSTTFAKTARHRLALLYASSPAQYARLKTALKKLERAGTRHFKAIQKLRSIQGQSTSYSNDASGSSQPQSQSENPSQTVIKVEKAGKTKVVERLRREILEADLDAKLKLFNFDIAQGIAVSARYRWAIEPSYLADHTTRIDSWKLKGELHVGDFVTDLLSKSPVGIYLNFSADREIIFARQFKSKIKSASALPYTPMKIPFTAEKARQLSVGDFVSLPINLRMVAGVNWGTELLSGLVPVSASVGASRVIAGACRLNILRLKDNRVRVRITAMRDRANRVLEGRIRTSFDIFLITFGKNVVTKFLDDQLGHLVGRGLFKVDAHKYDNRLFTWDYIYNLNNEEAARAYEAVMKASWKLKVIKGANPWSKIDKFVDLFVTDIRPTEQLVKEDADKPEEQQRVISMFKGYNQSSGKRNSFKFGLKILSFDKHSMSGWNRLQTFDKHDETQQYLMPINSSRKAWHFFFGYSKEETERTNFAILHADADWVPVGAAKLVAAFSKRDKRASLSEMKTYVRQLKAILGDELQQQLFNPSDLEKKVAGVSIKLVVSCSPKLMKQMFTYNSNTSEDKLWQIIAAVAAVFPPPTTDVSIEGSSQRLPYNISSFSAQKAASMRQIATLLGDSKRVLWNDLEEVVQYLRKAQRLRSLKDKADALMSLSQLPWMQGAFIRLLIELAKPNNYDGLFVHLTVRGDGIESIDATVGEDSLSQLYLMIQEITYNVNDNSYGMR